MKEQVTFQADISGQSFSDVYENFSLRICWFNQDFTELGPSLWPFIVDLAKYISS